jgi:hypothetical protein
MAEHRVGAKLIEELKARIREQDEEIARLKGRIDELVPFYVSKTALLEERRRAEAAEASGGGIDPYCCAPLATGIADAIRAKAEEVGR